MKYLLLFAALVFSQNAFSQTEVDPTFEKFWTQFKADLKAGKKAKVIDAFKSPFHSIDWYYLISPGGEAEIELNHEVLLKNYDKLLTKDAIKTLLKSEPVKTDLYGEETPTYTVVYKRSESSACWIVISKEDEHWQIISTDNVSYE